VISIPSNRIPFPTSTAKRISRYSAEAEGIINEFIAAWEAGAREGVFEAEKFKIDVTKSPVPRFDLLLSQ
jgi:hypothetical protein